MASRCSCWRDVCLAYSIDYPKQPRKGFFFDICLPAVVYAVRYFFKDEEAEEEKEEMSSSSNGRWNDDDAFFIKSDKQENIRPPSAKREREPSFVGYVEGFQSVTLEEPDQAAFDLLDENVTHEPPISPSGPKKKLNLDAIRESEAIPDNLKDEICNTLQERDISYDELLAKSDEDVDFLFPDPSVQSTVKIWKTLEVWKMDQLPTEALRLTNASKVGNLDVAKEILQKPSIPALGRKLLVDHRDEASHCRTPLMHASRHGHLALVGFLVKSQNADIYARDSHKLASMAIHFAAQGGFIEIVRFFIGIDPELVEAKNKNNDTPLNMAAVAGKLNVVECLVNEKKAKIENRGQYAMTPLLCAAEKGHVNVVRFLVEKGANIHAKDDKHSDLAVHWAARFGHLDVVSYLLDCRGDLIEATNALGRTPLHQAALGGHLPVVKFLAKRGANLVALSNEDDLVSNAIHLAAYFGHEQVVAFLLDNNPDLLEIENRDEKTPYILAKEEKRGNILSLLEARGARTTKKKF